MNLKTILGLARAEARLVRRLVRYWVFLVLAVGLMVAYYFIYAALHGFFSAWSPSVGALNPRYLVSALGFYYFALFFAGLVFLAFDVRGRDERERVLEVLESRPFSNLELVVGRFLGLLFQAFWPMAATGALLVAYGQIAVALDLPVGEPIEPFSMLALVVLMAPPALAFVLGLVFLIALLVRGRLIAAVLSVAVLVAFFVFLFRLPVDLAPLLDLTGLNSVNFPSDILPTIWTTSLLLQRSSVLALALGLLAFAAVVHPRLDGDRRSAWAGAGALLIVLGLGGFAFLAQGFFGARETRDAWRTAHEARRDAPAPDVQAIRGEVVIEPGKHLVAELEMDVAAPRETTLEQAVFTLNPGFEVEGVRGKDGRDLEFIHADGLLEVTLGAPLAPGEATEIAVDYSGRPDPRFAYLDSVITFSELKLTNAALVLLGYNASIFDRRYVALMPGVRWLPAAGPNAGRDTAERPKDFFTLDLIVDLPEGFTAAGPGRRRPVDGAAAGRSRARFAPPSPMPLPAVVAGRFEARSVEVAGVELEVLLSPAHTKNLEVFADAEDEIVGWIEERLTEAADLGLPYPNDGLSLVEVPVTLRGFKGGWRMGSSFAPPGLLLMRETSFPTTRFDNRFRDPENFADREGGIERAKLEALLTFFENDFNGGNLFLGAGRQFFAHATTARGDGALALDEVTRELATRLITGREGFFSAHVFVGQQEMNQVLAATLNDFGSRRSEGVTLAGTLLNAVTDRPEVWERALGTPLSELDPEEDPSLAIAVLTLKSHAIARWLEDGLGRENVGDLLALLRTRYAGESFTKEDFLAAANELGLDLELLLGDFLDATELPGFVASEARLVRLEDDEGGAPRYQLAVDLRNDEAAPGLVRLRYTVAESEGEMSSWLESEAFRIGAGEAVEIGLVLAKPPVRLRIEPYLSRNRGAFDVPLPELDKEEMVSAEPFRGLRPSSWPGPAGAAVVVDDLSEGFSVESDESSSGFRLTARGTADAPMDGGLPLLVTFQPPSEWSRRGVGEAWGKYRHTLAVIESGEGRHRAIFEAELDRSGPWRLELHLPPKDSLPRSWDRGTYHLEVVDANGDRRELTFDAVAAEGGWNELDEIEMPAGEARVILSDESDGRVVLADAVRFRAAGRTAAAADGSDVNQEESLDANDD